MKELNDANGEENPLVFNWWGFQILLFTGQEIQWQMFFPSEDEISVKVSIGDEISRYFITRTIFWLIFPVGRGAGVSVIRRCSHFTDPFVYTNC